MIRYFFKTMQGRIVGLFVIFMTVVFASTVYIVRYVAHNAIESEKEAKLLHVAIYQDRLLGEQDYDSILAEAGAADASREEKIAVLNRALSARTEEVAALFPGLGAGYYSLELDAILTYGPAAQYSNRVGTSITPDHPGQLVLRDNIDLVRIGTMSRGNIMNAMHPLVRGGEVIGYAWANELVTDIEQGYRQFSDNIILFFATLYIGFLLVAIVLARRMTHNVDTIISGVKKMRGDLSARIEAVPGELGEIADNINRMAADIEKNKEEHDALLRAEVANAAQRDFLSHMSHEIRTPMNAVIGMTNIARQTDDITKIKEYLRKIDDAADHLLGVINDVLDMSKIEAGKLELSETDFSFKKMLEQVITVTGFKIEEKNQHFFMEIGENVPEYVNADRQRLAQVITNLLSNANKFTPEGGNIRLRVNRLTADGQKCRLRIEVQDDGIGISSEQQAKLFQSFSQADNSISRKYGGTGLGLSISRQIVGLMGGGIRIESELGKGANFIIEIEVRTGAAAENQPEALPETGFGETQPGKLPVLDNLFAGRQILLAEDLEVNREIVLTLLEPTNAVIDCAENGVEAVEMFLAAPEKYDLILMDVQMPEMDGYEATRQIRRIGGKSAVLIPIIALTANVFQEDVDKCLASGMNGHIGKPFNLTEILAQLRVWLK